MSKEYYNNIPVFFCKSCLSLHIIEDNDNSESYCEKCGGTSIGRTSIIDWSFLYEKEYNKSFLNEGE